jgi:hypothetical protein
MCNRKPAVPLSYRYVPLYALPDAQTFLEALAVSQKPAILQRMAHIIDPDASMAALVEAEFFADPEVQKFKGIPDVQSDEIELIVKLSEAVDTTNRKRVRAINDPKGNAGRIQGEADQAKTDHPIAKTFTMESSRLGDLEDLWQHCGVAIDLEFSPHVESVDGPIDKEAAEFHGGGRNIDVGDVMAAEMRPLREAAGFCDRALPLALAQRDIPGNLEALAMTLGKTGLFAREGAFAVSFIREIRFYAHGQHGKPDKGIEAGFAFDGSMIETSLLEDPKQKKIFENVHKFMAPGSSVLFEGCDTGDGAAGKAFMEAIARIFFAPHKWGYVRANTEVTSIDPVNKKAGFRDGKPRTLMWPNDFV